MYRTRPRGVYRSCTGSHIHSDRFFFPRGFDMFNGISLDTQSLISGDEDEHCIFFLSLLNMFKKISPTIKALSHPAAFLDPLRARFTDFWALSVSSSLGSVWSSISCWRRRRGTTETRLTSLACCEWIKISHSHHQKKLSQERVIPRRWRSLGKARILVHTRFKNMWLHHQVLAVWDAWISCRENQQLRSRSLPR